MNTHIKTNTWVKQLLIVLGFTLAACVVGSVGLLFLGGLSPDLLLVLGTVAAAGLTRLLISPLNRELSE